MFLSDVEERLKRDNIPEVLFPFLFKNRCSTESFIRKYPSYKEKGLLLQSSNLQIYDIENEDIHSLGVRGEYCLYGNDLLSLVKKVEQIEFEKYKYIIGFMRSRNPVGFVLDVYQKEESLFKRFPTIIINPDDILFSFEEVK